MSCASWAGLKHETVSLARHGTIRRGVSCLGRDPGPASRLDTVRTVPCYARPNPGTTDYRRGGGGMMAEVAAAVGRGGGGDRERRRRRRRPSAEAAGWGGPEEEMGGPCLPWPDQAYCARVGPARPERTACHAWVGIQAYGLARHGLFS